MGWVRARELEAGHDSSLDALWELREAVLKQIDHSLH